MPSRPGRSARAVLPGLTLAFGLLGLLPAGVATAQAPRPVAAQATIDAAPLLPAQGTVQALFTPGDEIETVLVALIGAARHSIHVQAFSFTSRPLAVALQAARRRGVAVSVLADRQQAEQLRNSRLPQLVAAGIAVALETRYTSAHNKVLLIDADESRPVLVTGSYNFTWSAQNRNAENVLIVRDHPALARRYLDNWQRHRRDALDWATYLKQPAPARQGAAGSR